MFRLDPAQSVNRHDINGLVRTYEERLRRDGEVTLEFENLLIRMAFDRDELVRRLAEVRKALRGSPSTPQR
jgi:hypothetical protein